MKVKGIYLSDKFYSAEELPKEIALPLHKDELFFDKYRYVVVVKPGDENQDVGNGRDSRHKEGVRDIPKSPPPRITTKR